MSAAPPNYVKIRVLELDRLSTVTKGAEFKCTVGISSENEGFDISSKPAPVKTAPAIAETNRIVWSDPEEITLKLPSSGKAILVRVKSKKGRSTEDYGYMRFNIDGLNHSTFERWLPLRKNKKDLTGTGFIRVAVSCKTPAMNAASIVGKTVQGAMSPRRGSADIEDKQVSKRLRKKQREERQRIVQQKVKLGYKSGDINMRLFHVPSTSQNEGALGITLVSGEGLAAMDLDGTSDPYGKIFFNGYESISPIIKSNLNPKWDYYCQFIIPTNFDLFTKVRVEIWDYDRGSVDDLIGIADLVLDDYFTPEMMDAKEVEVSFPILKKEKAVTDLLDGLKEGSTAKKTMKPKLPIALIPGLASTVLIVKKGDKYWMNERIWFSLDKIYKGKMNRMAIAGSHTIDEEKDPEADYSIREQKLLSQNKWVDHMCLNEADNSSDPEGIQVRAMQGYEGVSYLADGIAKNMTYVMGPLIENLQEFGYTEKNLAALPYDWRIPLATLETRDKYFTQVKTTLETLYNNTGLPVVVVCHSMGNRVFQYFLNYAKKYYGQEWIDKYVHTFYAVGAPFLGATKILRAVVSGERFGLDFFLSTSEAIKFARTVGSFPSMLPIGLKKYFDPKAFCYVRKDDSRVLTKARDKQDKAAQKAEISIKTKSEEWISYDNETILELSGAQKQLEVFKKQYLTDPLFGGSEDPNMAFILEAPPVKKMRHIYGVNVNTEKLYFYRLNKDKHRMDLDKKLDGTLEQFPGYQFTKGTGYETLNTPQANIEKFTGFGGSKSGDGTVPYDSLNYCLKWREKLDLEVMELERAEHRDIVSTRMFFKLLVEYAGE
jgi:hypothetical protein